ncbi:MAG: hypothetical protein KJ886_02970 [Candidatus Thermoplasmatota archaeon]|nr:hypothetical protein [Candidatus Thermoplasmatota archaeon]MBU4256166.1 hypothetical protein [Candidatus Thermoplasmatota archaeon]MCG2825426.1 hypothetical protein [Thermoplasmatales archaeon]
MVEKMFDEELEPKDFDDVALELARMKKLTGESVAQSLHNNKHLVVDWDDLMEIKKIISDYKEPGYGMKDAVDGILKYDCRSKLVLNKVLGHSDNLKMILENMEKIMNRFERWQEKIRSRVEGLKTCLLNQSQSRR